MNFTNKLKQLLKIFDRIINQRLCFQILLIKLTFGKNQNFNINIGFIQFHQVYKLNKFFEIRARTYQYYVFVFKKLYLVYKLCCLFHLVYTFKPCFSEFLRVLFILFLIYFFVNLKNHCFFCIRTSFVFKMIMNQIWFVVW